MNIFMWHIFWSTWNAEVIAQTPDHNKKNGGLLLVANAAKNRSFVVIKSIAIELLSAKHLGL